jgi:hypothetical protein
MNKINDVQEQYLKYGNDLFLSSKIFKFSYEPNRVIYAFTNGANNAGFWFNRRFKSNEAVFFSSDYKCECIGTFYHYLNDDEKKIFLDELLNIYGNVFGFNK